MAAKHFSQLRDADRRLEEARRLLTKVARSGDSLNALRIEVIEAEVTEALRIVRSVMPQEKTRAEVAPPPKLREEL